MAGLSSIKDRLFQRQLRQRRAGTAAELRDGRAVHPAMARDLLILFPADSAEARRQLDRWRDANRRSDLRIRVLGYFDQEVGSTNFDFEVVTVKDLNWYGAPRGAAVDKFREGSVDLLYRLGPPEHRVLDFLAATRGARLKVGPYSPAPHHPYHLQYDAALATRVPDQLAGIASLFKFTNAS